MSKFVKGFTPWNKNKKGYKCYSKKLELFNKVKELVLKGATSTEIASRLCICSPTVFSIIRKKDPSLEKILRKSGKLKISKRKVTPNMIKRMLLLSSEGRGVDLIGKKIGVHGTTVIHYLKTELGKEEYTKRHNIKKYTSYWSGRYFTNKRGDRLQSSLEEEVADFLYQQGIKYKTQTCLILPEGKFYPDIELFDFGGYIEIFGMSDLDFYKLKMDYKKKIYNKNKIKYIDINKNNFKYFKSIIIKELDL